MNENLKLTNSYKAEITDVLSKISAGLSESVIAVMEPKIQKISTNVQSQNELVHKIIWENKTTSDNLNKRVENFGASVKSIQSTTENLEKSIEKRNSYVTSSIDKNSDILSQLKKTYSDGLYSEIQNISSSVRSQKNLEQVIIVENKKTSDGLNERLNEFGSIVKKTNQATENLEKSVEQGNSDIVLSIDKNTDILSQLRKTCGDDLVSEIQKISNKDEYKLIEIQITQLQTKLQTTEKLIYVILACLVILSGLIIFLVFK